MSGISKNSTQTALEECQKEINADPTPDLEWLVWARCQHMSDRSVGLIAFDGTVDDWMCFYHFDDTVEDGSAFIV